MQCEMCGAKGVLYRAVIEDTEMAVCKECSSFGKVLGEIRIDLKYMPKRAAGTSQSTKPVSAVVPVRHEMLVNNYPDLIKKKREKLSMTQAEFAAMVTEKESIIHKIETGTIELSIKMARKFEKILKIRLIEEYEEAERPAIPGAKPERLTIGDMVTIRRRL